MKYLICHNERELDRNMKKKLKTNWETDGSASPNICQFVVEYYLKNK